MDYRMNKKAIIGVVVLLLVAAGLFAYTIFSDKSDTVENDNVVENDSTSEPTQIITTKHAFEDGTHVFAGEIEMPTPCDKLDASVFFVDGNTEKPEIRFTSANQSDGACAQVITPARFKVEAKAPESAAFSASLNGKAVRLNIIEVPEGENLDDFEIFIKG